MELAPGTVIDDRYMVLELVKSGGMGAVYQVRDLRLADTLGALKQLHYEGDTGGEPSLRRYRFNEEMRVLTGLRHAGIPRVFDFFVHVDTFCIVMDFIAGENLEQVVARVSNAAGVPSGLPVQEVLEIADQVLDILTYLHAQSPPVVHRDIKPANLIRQTGSGRIMLVDFGLARPIAAGAVETQTMAGTLGYAPVEQFQGRSEPASDLYGLGASLHHLLTGVVPRAFNPAPLQDVLPGADAGLVELINKAVAMLPADRFPDPAAMRDAVRRLRVRSEPGAVVAAAPEPVATHAAERILLVDDDAMVRDVVRRLLEREQYQVTTAESGEKALEIALRTPPDMIISDVDMPGLDGLALCRKLRSHRTTRNIPVLLLTGRADVEDEARGLEEGAEDYIAKPIVPMRLVARVQAAMRRRFSS